MDKYEYNLKLDQMKSLFSDEKYEEAAELADSINWAKIKNPTALLRAGEIYEKTGRYADSREVLMLAYERSPIGRSIIYRLAEVAIKMQDFTAAEEYYNDFVAIAPHDNMKYVLRYDLQKAKGASYQDLIAILEEFKEQEYTEEWAYELAYLYHKAGMSDKCIEACDELILWFGDGPYVERALELKMLYQPLTKAQEDKYRAFRQAHEGYTHIDVEEMERAGEHPHEPVAIPPIEVTTGQFNTINLQAEIARGMQQIMDATEKSTVADTLDSLNRITDEIPYLKIQKSDEAPAVEVVHIETDEEINNSLKDNFKNLLAEDSDGQISMMVDEKKRLERQITGQITIEEALGEWERTKRAAEVAMQDAEQRKLESAKARALQQAGDLMSRLTDVKPKLDAGVTPRELLEEEYLKDKDDGENVFTAENQGLPVAGADALGAAGVEDLEEHIGDGGAQEGAEPDLETMGGEDDVTGLELAARHPKQEEPADKAPENTDAERVENAEPTEAETGNEEAAAYAAAASRGRYATGLELASKHPESILTMEEAVALGIAPAPAESADKFRVPEFLGGPKHDKKTDMFGSPERLRAAMNDMAGAFGVNESEMRGMTSELGLSDSEVIGMADALDDGAQQKAQGEAKETAENAAPEKEEKDKKLTAKEKRTQEKIEKWKTKTIKLPEIVMPEDLGEDEAAEEEKKAEKPVEELTEEQKTIFSYFMPVKGMEDQLCRAITRAKRHLLQEGTASEGNLIIQGSQGCGKTTLATSVIKVLQQETGHPNDRIGKIKAGALNKKDIGQLLKKVAGGCLIIEEAGELTRQTEVRLSLLLEQDSSGIFIIIEDVPEGINKALSLDDGFAKKFTESITVPIFTNDDLVTFAHSYAKELGYEIEEVAVLALYNRISNIQRLDQATTLTEVKDIVDEAIAREAHGGMKKYFSILTAARYTDDDRIVLREKDFA